MTRLVESSIARLAAPHGQRDAYLWDSTLPGFGVRAFASGKKSFVVKYQLPDGKQRKMSLGPALGGTLAETRKKAQDILAHARTGRDVQGEKHAARERAKREKPTGDLIATYLELKRSRVRDATYRELDRHLNQFLAPLHTRPIDSIARRDIVEIIDERTKLGKFVQADRLKTSAVSFFNWAIERDHLQANPAAGIARRTPAEQVERDRVLAMDELAAVWLATEGTRDYDKIVRLLLLTGARADEISCLEWCEVDLDRREITLPPQRMKNKREHTIFLGEAAHAILSSIAHNPDKPHVFGQTLNGPFSGWSKCKARLDGKLGEKVKPWRHHDLRRSLATNAADLGLASTVVIEMALGHWSGEKRGIVKTYNKSTHDRERRRLMDDWANVVIAHAERVS